MNPDSVSLEDIKEMRPGEFRQWTFLMIQRLDERTRRIDQRLWMVLATIILSILLVILTALI